MPGTNVYLLPISVIWPNPHQCVLSCSGDSWLVSSFNRNMLPNMKSTSLDKSILLNILHNCCLLISVNCNLPWSSRLQLKKKLQKTDFWCKGNISWKLDCEINRKSIFIIFRILKKIQAFGIDVYKVMRQCQCACVHYRSLLECSCFLLLPWRRREARKELLPFLVAVIVMLGSLWKV